ncbi:TPA: hypothetical protein JFP82_001946 [Vibrio cholerae O1]|uniref:Uncharacterized protein n=1 Tax=Vibrio cholerae TaxID=666 RepID=A0ABD7SRB3_VIBCL|nr:hypothetical protein [Vibrio cholerae]HAU9839143.1 hypothetical protein [Vibrio cholerae O1]TXX67337.1 hypothetical protein FXF03_01820 [Vibrio cholerae]GIA99045.1 hypothetical protein VCSRO136_2233 [Vibrio cholerae]HDI3136711.1 hypothetical protein [Vibrio cholerae]HDI3249876.1 hypothetical protein [Vibrio cholerae]
MNLLTQLASELKQNHSRPAKVNIALQVVSYHLEGDDPTKHYVTGLNIENNQEIKVSLRPDSRNVDLEKNPELKRYELADYADKSRESSYVVASADSKNNEVGVLVLTDCVKTGENSYTAGWAHSAIHNTKDNKESLEVGLCSVDIYPPSIDGSRHAKAQVRLALLKQSEVFDMGNVGGLLNKIKTHMQQPKGSGYFIPEVIIRLIDNSNPEDTYGPTTMTVVLKAPTKKIGEDDIPIYCTPDECMTLFLHPDSKNPSHKDLQSIINFCKNPEIATMPQSEMAIEVIPVERRNFGPETAADFFERKTITIDGEPREIIGLSAQALDLKDKFNMRVIEKDESGEENVSNNRMFTTSIFVLNKHKDANVDYHFVSKIFTTLAWPKGYNEKHLPTPYFKELMHQEDQYLVSIRTDEKAMTAEQLALLAQRKEKAAAKQSQQLVESTKSPQPTVQSTAPANGNAVNTVVSSKNVENPKAESVQHKSETVVEHSKPVPTNNPEPVATSHTSKPNDIDSDFDDELSMDLAELDGLFNPQMK